MKFVVRYKICQTSCVGPQGTCAVSSHVNNVSSENCLLEAVLQEEMLGNIYKKVFMVVFFSIQAPLSDHT